jgi:hypothetical protein
MYCGVPEPEPATTRPPLLGSKMERFGIVGVEGLLVVVTQAEVDVQLRRELPGVLRERPIRCGCR